MLSSESDSDIELSQNKTCGICKIKLTMKCLYCNLLCDKLVCLPCLDMNTKLFDVLRPPTGFRLQKLQKFMIFFYCCY